MSVSLDSRQMRMMRWLLKQDEPQSTAAMATDLGLSQRVVRYRLTGIEKFLKGRNLELTKKRGVGIWISGTTPDIAQLRTEIRETSEAAPRVFARDERFDLLRASLLFASPEPVSLERLQDDLQVSKTSARRDAKRAEPWLEHQGLVLARKAGVGLSIVGPELSVRRAIVKLILEVIPTELLLGFMSSPDQQWSSVRLSAGMTEFLRDIPLHECWSLTQSHKPLAAITGEGEIMLPVFLATTARRMQQRQRLTMDAGQLRSLLDHPVATSARLVAEDVGSLVDVPVSEQDIAAIAEVVLGLVSLNQDVPMPPAPDELVTKMMELAGERLHPFLAADGELRRGLTQHLERLVVRLKYGLPVHNPLLQEVSNRYPDVHVVAAEIAELASTELGAQLPEDEIGFITMYLSGAMERTHLWPRPRAVIVCPSGVATAWILVARIQAEFPQLDLVDVISARDVDDDIDADVVISTVDLGARDEHSIPPTVVVKPLLPTEDVRTLARILAK